MPHYLIKLKIIFAIGPLGSLSEFPGDYLKNLRKKSPKKWKKNLTDEPLSWDTGEEACGVLHTKKQTKKTKNIISILQISATRNLCEFLAKYKDGDLIWKTFHIKERTNSKERTPLFSLNFLSRGDLVPSEKKRIGVNPHLKVDIKTQKRSTPLMPEFFCKSRDE